MELNSRLPGILGSLGIFLITAGVVALAFQQGALAVKLACIFGYGFAAYALSLYVAHKKASPEVAATLLVNAAGMLMWGIEVYIGSCPGCETLARVVESGMLLTLFAISWHIGRQTLSLLGSIICIQTLYLEVIHLCVGTISLARDGAVIALMMIGSSYAIQQLSPRLSYWLRLIGSLLIGIVLYDLGDWALWSRGTLSSFTQREIMWQALWPIVGIALVYLGLTLRDNALFIGGMTSIIGVIFAIASMYARFVLGLPITLMLFGIVSIAISYGMIRLKHRVS